MNLYRTEMQLVATVYIKAASEDEANAKARTLEMKSLTLIHNNDDLVAVSGLQFDDPELPDVSFSPAVTICGLWEDEVTEEVE